MTITEESVDTVLHPASSGRRLESKTTPRSCGGKAGGFPASGRWPEGSGKGRRRKMQLHLTACSLEPSRAPRVSVRVECLSPPQHQAPGFYEGSRNEAGVRRGFGQEENGIFPPWQTRCSAHPSSMRCWFWWIGFAPAANSHCEEPFTRLASCSFVPCLVVNLNN